MAASLDRLTDALAGRYRIERLLGSGGMADVYLAQDLKHPRRVAIKVLKPELAAVLGRERFLREIELAATLQHPFILGLLDSGAAGELLYYVMPYLEGDTLRQRLEREKQLPLEDTLRITAEIAEALDHAHRQGVVHRDIKPENILFEGGHALVADFGIARAVGLAGGTKLTETGVTLGTSAYQSPEQALGGRELDGRSDQYSLACVAYEMLAGQPPFTGPTAGSLAHQHLNVVPRPVTELRPAVPAAAAAALERALAKGPADRFNTVTLLAQALGHRDSTAMAANPPAASSATAATTMAMVLPARRRWRRFAWFGGAAVVVVAAVLLISRPGRKAPGPAGPTHTRSEIAVLPFQNLSAEGPHAYFAGGLHDELLTQLAKVAALKVISRTSVMGYQGSAKPLRQIATELGVGSVLEGSVQVEGERLRVNVQLIDAATDEHQWAEHYDRTLDDAFAIQSEVAQRIVAAVGAALTRAEQGRLTAAPTANAEAYQLYLQGREYGTRPGYLRQNLEPAQQLYERALALDPNFALAHAALSRVHGHMRRFGHDPSPTRTARQREEAEAALRLAPDLPEAHYAMGSVHVVGPRDYRRALQEFTIALEGLPNDSELWHSIGDVQRRLGNWDKVFEAFERAAQVNPRDATMFYGLGACTYQFLHRYADAVRADDRALSLAPDLHAAAISRGWTYVSWQGQLDTLRAVLSRVPRDVELGAGAEGNLTTQRAELLLLERNADGLLQTLQGARDDFPRFPPPALYAARAHQLRGDHMAARSAFDSALVRLDSALSERPDGSRVHAARGMSLAGLGRRDAALREARWLRRSVVYREDAYEGPRVAEDRARILAQAGEADAALDEIERLLAGPSWLSVHTLRLDPVWDPIREHPRFKALLVKYANPEPVR